MELILQSTHNRVQHAFDQKGLNLTEVLQQIRSIFVVFIVFS